MGHSFAPGAAMFVAMAALCLVAGQGPAFGQSSGGKAASEQKPPAQPARGAGGRPTMVMVDTVSRAEQTETFPVYGRVVASQAGIVATQVRGGVAAIMAHVGDRVRKGDILVVLQTDMLQNELALKQAELAEYRAKTRTAQAQLRLTEQELQRLQRLRNSAAFSAARFQDKQQDVERFRSTVAETAARVNQAEAELNIAALNLENASIRAPYDGVVTRRHTEAGAYLNVGDQVVTMTNDAALEIEADVPAARLSGLTEGSNVTVDPETAPRFNAQLRAIVPEENPLSRTRTVRFVPSERAGSAVLAANQSIIVHIPAGKPRVVTTAHKDALLHRRGGTVMFVVADGKAALRPVTIGQSFGSRFEIVRGLAPGDQVVVRGNERLRPGQEVMIRRPGGPNGARGGTRDSTGGMRGKGPQGAGRSQGRPAAPDAK